MASVKPHLSATDSSIESLKEELASHIKSLMLTRRLTRAAAAELTGTTRARIASLWKGYQGWSLEALFEVLIQLENEIIIEVFPTPTAKKIRLVSRNDKN
jgi:predicted XRE-type DNA-binding protein